MFGLEAVLLLDRSSSDDAFKVPLDRQRRIVLTLFWVEVATLTSRILCLLCIKLNLVWLSSTTSLSHLECEVVLFIGCSMKFIDYKLFPSSIFHLIR